MLTPGLTVSCPGFTFTVSRPADAIFAPANKATTRKQAVNRTGQKLFFMHFTP